MNASERDAVRQESVRLRERAEYYRCSARIHEVPAISHHLMELAAASDARAQAFIDKLNRPEAVR